MDHTTLGQTGLRVSVAGLGGGGYSRLGLGTGGDEANAGRVVRAAIDLGVNFIDTAETYGTQEVVGRALKGVRREDVVLSTKKCAGRQDNLSTPEAFGEGVEVCLRELQTDYIDVFHLHATQIPEYDYVVGEIVPVVQAMRDEGKIRFIGVTEMFNGDSAHGMLSRAVRDDCWDVIMVGLNMLNPSACRDVLPLAAEKGIGGLVMFAVRNALSQPDRLREVLDDLAAQGKLDADTFDSDDPLGFLLTDGGADSIVEAAYRYCRHQPGVNVVLTGTGDVEHLTQNISAICKPPLPETVLQRLDDLFGHVDCVSGS
jgi:L-galactose dehydrogenase